MDAQQQYLFDLQGYIVLRDVVPSAVVAACNQVLDRFETMDEADYLPPLCLGDQRTQQNLYISNILEGDQVFRSLIDIPAVLDVVATVTGGPYRLNHTYATIAGAAATLACTCTARPSFPSVSITAATGRWSRP